MVNCSISPQELSGGFTLIMSLLILYSVFKKPEIPASGIGFGALYAITKLSKYFFKKGKKLTGACQICCNTIGKGNMDQKIRVLMIVTMIDRDSGHSCTSSKEFEGKRCHYCDFRKIWERELLKLKWRTS